MIFYKAKELIEVRYAQVVNKLLICLQSKEASFTCEFFLFAYHYQCFFTYTIYQIYQR